MTFVLSSPPRGPSESKYEQCNAVTNVCCKVDGTQLIQSFAVTNLRFKTWMTYRVESISRGFKTFETFKTWMTHFSTFALSAAKNKCTSRLSTKFLSHG